MDHATATKLDVTIPAHIRQLSSKASKAKQRSKDAAKELDAALWTLQMNCPHNRVVERTGYRTTIGRYIDERRLCLDCGVVEDCGSGFFMVLTGKPKVIRVKVNVYKYLENLFLGDFHSILRCTECSNIFPSAKLNSWHRCESCAK